MVVHVNGRDVSLCKGWFTCVVVTFMSCHCHSTDVSIWLEHTNTAVNIFAHYFDIWTRCGLPCVMMTTDEPLTMTLPMSVGSKGGLGAESAALARSRSPVGDMTTTGMVTSTAC